ncbi:MAG: hypothetical protein AAFV43_16440 [Planctomycetota bacterium]
MLREKTQRRLCRVLFVVVCAAPLALCVGWAIARQTPSYREMEQRRVSDALGLRCEWTRHATPRPGEHVLRGVSLYSRGVATPALEADEVRLRRAGQGWRLATGTLTVIDPADAERIAAELRDAIIGDLSIARLQLGADPGVVYEAVTAKLTADEVGVVLVAQAEANAASCRLEWRHGTENDAKNEVQIDTGDHAVPVTWLPTPASETAAARFRGTLEQAGESGTAAGRLFVAASNSTSGPIRATWAPLTVTIHDAAWVGERVESFCGKLEINAGGWAHRSLLEAATTHLGARQTKRVAEQMNGEALWYDRFACDIEVNAEGVALLAGCGEENGKPLAGRIAHAVLQSGGEALLLEPRERPLPIAAVLRSLWPEAEANLPAASPAARLASRLPLE